jgi:RND family efflux transporter MFP subunit
MIGRYRFVVVIAVALGFVVAGSIIAGWLRMNSHHSSAANSNRAHRAAAVAFAKRGEISNTISIAGEFLPYQEVELHGKVTGYIRKINIDIGDHVGAGQLLAVLEVPELAAQVQSADAGIRHSQDEILRAQDELSRDEASHTALHADAARLKEAAEVRPGLVAQQELDDAEAKDRAGEAQIEAAKSALSAARQQLDIARATQVQVAAISDYSRICAPFDGVITWRYSDTGALVQAGTSAGNAQPIVRIAQVNILRLRIPVPESLAATVHDGQLANIRVQATGEEFTGTVARFTDSLDRSTRSMQVEIDVPNDKLRITPGMYADVILQLQKHADALLIPFEAINQSDNGPSVLVVDKRNRVQPQEIRTGLQSPDSVEVTAGLNEGDRVITGNLSSYHAGEIVDPKLGRSVLTEMHEGKD